MRTILLCLACGILGACAPAMKKTGAGGPESPPFGVVRLSDVSPEWARQDWGELGINKSAQEKPLRIGKQEFSHGLGTHANSEIVYDLDGRYDAFESWVGVDAEMDSFGGSTVVFRVLVDGKESFNSGVMRNDTPARRVNVAVKGASELKLVVNDGGDSIDCDHADWADAILTGAKAGKAEAPAKQARFRVVCPSLTIKLTGSGEIAGVVLKGNLERAINAQTKLTGCKVQGRVRSRELAGGGMEFARELVSASSQRRCTLVERFMPTENSIRWEMEIRGEGEPWSTSIATLLNYPADAGTRFWTAWSDPEHRDEGWRDPLVLRPFAGASWSYANNYATPTRGDFISLPLVTVAEPARDAGLSLVLSPEDVLVDMRVRTDESGAIRLSRVNHRLGGGKPVRFAMDLTAHEADWRGGLRWMVARYPQFFDPPNPLADEMAGCGAYSGDENPIDAARFKRMAFRINWKLSDDFPYMGMFLPPLLNPDDRWERSCDEPFPPNKPRWTSFRRMNDYAKWMRGQGFHVLNYFNVTEFGKNVRADVTVPADRTSSPDLWKDSSEFLKARLSGAVLIGGAATCYGASVTDPGDPTYQQFLLEQAERHNRMIPDSSGICIDRMDWLRFYNRKADDGVSWLEGKPARFCGLSWNSLLARLGPLMHGAGKVIFVNSMTARLDLMRHVDGFYSEQGDSGASLNASALMGLRKPALEWTPSPDTLKPDPDAFFQRHLHMGAYPTAPYPTNHHCIQPDPWADQQFLDYGPLLDAMRGKKWVLVPHCVESATPGVKVNLFQVPGGYALPVTFGGKTESARVRIRNVTGLEKAQCEAVLPGYETAQPIAVSFKDGELDLQVPLRRGCAMVRIVVR